MSKMSLDYALLDFGHGRKLERFGGVLLDRPSPPAEGFSKKWPDAEWARADASFQRLTGLSGKWRFRTPLPEAWPISCGDFSLELKPTDVGHLGIFAEQAENWKWIAASAAKCLKNRRTLRVLNLFAYTGASTLAAAAAIKVAAQYDSRDWSETKSNETTGLEPPNHLPLLSGRSAPFHSAPVPAASITHVDAAKNVVQWARRNAELSGMRELPIRWIAEDAMKFAERETRRGRAYDAVILDPPSYGHGTGAEVWKIEKDLPRLMECCASLTGGAPAFFLITAHSPDFPAERLAEILKTFFPRVGPIHSGEMSLRTADGRKLPSGEMARMAAGEQVVFREF